VNDPMRSTHLERLRARIQSDAYEVDDQAVADAIIRHMLVPVRAALDPDRGLRIANGTLHSAP
jgi:Anti-sigma-28 factor, FlgM